MLNNSQAELILAHYGIDGVGDMHGRSGRNVLHVAKTVDQLARLLQQDAGQVAREIHLAKRKLLTRRRERTMPSVDKTVFADLNGMLIDAYLTVYERLGEPQARQKALNVLDYLLADFRDDRGVFAHYRDKGSLQRVGQLADQAWMARALLHAYEVTVDAKYLQAAEKAADAMLQHLVAEDGGFVNSPVPADNDPTASFRMRSWEDAPSRSAASVAAQMLIDLGHLSGQEKYTSAAAKALDSFAGGAERRAATFLGGYGVAAEHLLYGPRSVLVAGPTTHPTFEALAQAARRAYIPGAVVIALDPRQSDHAGLLKRLGYAADGKSVAYVCRSKACLQPAYTIEELKQRIDQLRTAP